MSAPNVQCEGAGSSAFCHSLTLCYSLYGVTVIGVDFECIGRDSWKKKYFEEKRKTLPLEEESKKLRNELDAANKKILSHMDKSHDGQQSSAGQPSQQVSSNV